ncbi:putative RNA-directed DNA polymerase, eukaryota, reverse transcriptase zinc-binding domain protein [Tanacetum coccineum]
MGPYPCSAYGRNFPSAVNERVGRRSETDCSSNVFDIVGFKETNYTRPSFISNLFKQLTPEENLSLECPITSQEIKNAVWDCGGDKAPGPDGFSFKLIKKHWNLLGDDIIKYVKDFHLSASIPRGCNSSFITLAPKVDDPITISDFRPISLIGCQYKIIAKVLANRLALVIPSVVSEVQMAFIKGRQITDGPLLVNEIISWAKKHKKKMLLLKLDFEKAFDSLSWSFLDSIMSQMGFGEKWRKMIHSCLNSAYASVLVNGSPTNEFKIGKGLRQGDPLSPFLFILAVEALNVVLVEARNRNIFLGADVGRDKIPISHLQFADDALIVGQWSVPNAKNLTRILTCFNLASGLKVNFNKSKLFGIGVSSNEVNSVACSIGCQPSQLPCTYLGLPIGANMSRCSNWSPVVDRFQKRLSTWKCKNLSYGGRLTLIKSVLESLGVYFFSTFKAPISIIKKLESILGPRDQGGLNIGSLKVFNQAMLTKWWWRFLLEENALWRKVIVSIHGNCGGFKTDSHTPYKSGPWYQVLKMKDDLSPYGISPLSLFKKKVGNGQTTRFWIDPWLGGPPLRCTFPRLYRLELNPECLICDRAPQSLNNIGSSNVALPS